MFYHCTVLLDLVHTSLSLAAFFLTGQTRPDPAWPFFIAGRRRNDRPDRVRPGLAIQKNAAIAGDDDDDEVQVYVLRN